MTIAWTSIGLLSGSLMFSYWLGLMARHNLKAVGDGNPGAINLWRAAGWSWGLAGIVLDFVKGYGPVALALNGGAVEGHAVVGVAAAPVVGHALSPFLRFRGGKGIAVTFGVWSALTGFKVVLVYAVILAVLLAIARLLSRGRPTTSEADAFQVVAGMLLVGVYLYAGPFSADMLWCWLAILIVLVYTHRRELGRFIGGKRIYTREMDT